jgi:hypothetical protein
MQKYQMSLASLLLLSGGLPIWLFLIVVVPQGPGWGGSPIKFVVAPIVLGGVTVAIRRLFGNRQEAWAISVLLAAIIILSALCAAVWISSNS